MTDRRCSQCWQPRPAADFVGATGAIVRRCAECREKYANWQPGRRASEPRRSLPIVSNGPPRVIFNARTGNSKLGRMPAAIVSGETCPPSCGFYGKGCFAEFGFLGSHWRRAGVEGLEWRAFLASVMSLQDGALWRYAVAGDLPGQGDELDVRLLGELVEANLGRRGFAFTHKPLDRAHEVWAVRGANAAGFTINLSADNLAHADARAELQAGPVAVVLPAGAGGDIRTPNGRRVVLCPAETRGLTCSQCQLCSKAERKGVVGFVAHGQSKVLVSRIASEAAA